jgi:uncharacterized protein (DUF433 family)
MKMIAYKYNRITVDTEQMNGQPCIWGMCLTVKRVLEALRLYPDHNELFIQYPELEEDDIQQALAFAAESVSDVIMIGDQAA